MTVTAKTKGLRQGLGKVWAWLVGDGYTRSPLTGRAALDWVPHGGPAVEGSATDGASRTAIMTAQFRAAHALVDRDPIFEDRFALALADRSAAEVMEFLAASVPHSCAHVVRLFVGQRSRFAEEEVASAVAAAWTSTSISAPV